MKRPDRRARRDRWRIRLLVIATSIGCGGPVSTALAQSSDDASVFTFSLENDIASNVDGHYTNGLRFAWLATPSLTPGLVRDSAARLPFVRPDSEVRFEYALSQTIYTPRDIDRPVPDPTDRPYAGWLNFTVGVVAKREGLLDQLQIGLGIVGPSSRADEFQRLIHDVTGSTEPRGWGYQIDDEPTLQFVYQRSWRQLYVGKSFGYAYDLTPHVGAALGNAFTYANGGVTLRYGRDLPDDFGPPRIEPTHAGSGYFKQHHNGFGWYLFAGVDGRAVARNMFLDGNAFRDGGPSVERKVFVGDLQAGFALVFGRARVSYTHVVRSKEFETQREGDSFGSFNVSVRF